MKHQLKLLILLLFFLLIKLSDAQNQARVFYLKGIIKNIQSDRLFAYSESSKGKTFVDSIKIESNQNFVFPIKTNSYREFIYIRGNKEQFSEPLIIFISGASDTISFISNSNQIIDSTIFINSEENTQFYQFQKMMKLYSEKLSYLQKIISYYPYRDEIYFSNEKLFDKLLNQFTKERTKLYTKLKKNPYSAQLAEYVLIQKELFLSALSNKTNCKELKQQLNTINNSTQLLNTDILENVFVRFIGLLHNDSIPQLQMEKTVADSFFCLMRDSNYNKELKSKIGNMYVSYLSRETYYKTLQNYLLSIGDKQEIADEKALLTVGEKINSLKGISSKGYLIDINDFNSEYKVVFVWSPECGHCAEVIPDLNKIYFGLKDKNIQFYSFSVLRLDSTQKNVFQWNKSTSILNSWANEFLMKYSINYTTLIILLDKNNRIIEIPSNPQKLSMILSKLLL